MQLGLPGSVTSESGSRGSVAMCARLTWASACGTFWKETRQVGHSLAPLSDPSSATGYDMLTSAAFIAGADEKPSPKKVKMQRSTRDSACDLDM